VHWVLVCIWHSARPADLHRRSQLLLMPLVSALCKLMTWVLLIADSGCVPVNWLVYRLLHASGTMQCIPAPTSGPILEHLSTQLLLWHLFQSRCTASHFSLCFCSSIYWNVCSALPAHPIFCPLRSALTCTGHSLVGPIMALWPVESLNCKKDWSIQRILNCINQKTVLCYDFSRCNCVNWRYH